MDLKRLHLRNFCQHRDLVVEFSSGITGILGGNGRGKSNIIKAIRFVILGESGNAGVKIEDLNWQAAIEGEPGFVELEFEAGGETGKIKRFVSATRASLKHGSKKTASSSKATLGMLKLSGTTRGTYEDVIFVDQGKIETVLFEKPADRAKKFQRLFGTEAAEKLRQLLHQELALLTTDPVDDRIKELEQQLGTDVDPQLRALNDQGTKIQAEINRHDFSALKSLIDAYHASGAAKAKIADLMLDKQRNEDGVDPSVLLNLAEEVEKLTDEIQAKRVTIDAARAHLLSVQAARITASTRDTVQQEIAEFERKCAEPAPVAPDVDQQQLSDSETQLTLAQTEVARKTDFIQTFEEGRPLCPTCSQVVSNVLAQVEAARAVVEERSVLVTQVEEMINAARRQLFAYSTAVKQHTKDIAAAQEQLAKKREQFATLSAIPVPVGDAEQLKQQVAEFEALESTLNDKDEALRAMKELGARSSGELEAIERQVKQLEADVSDITNKQCEEAQLLVMHVEKVRLELAGVQGQLKQLQSTRVNVLAELEGLRAQAGKLESKRKYKLLCERTRELLHRDVLPRRVTQRYLTLLNAGIQEHLSAFGVPFSCHINDELEVPCNIPGVGEKPAARLSGGQKVLLGIGFRFAICKLFAASLGFVVLDEPTVMLDDDNIGIVSDLMNTVRGHALNSGLQLIVVTHEQRLTPAFDHVIQL